jgi:hypothetical protein
MGCALLLADGHTVTEPPAAVTSMREQQLDVVVEALRSLQRGVAALRVTVGDHAVRLDDVDVRLDDTASRVDTVDGSSASRRGRCSVSCSAAVADGVCHGMVTGTVLQLTTAVTALRSQLQALRGTTASTSDVDRMSAQVC